MKQLVDKVSRHKVTRLKKTILAARKRKEFARQLAPDNRANTKDLDDSGFETVNSDDEQTD